MYMSDWIAKLDDFMRISERDILTHAGTVSHDEALEKARKEYEAYRKRMLEEPSAVERHFVEVVNGVKQLEKSKPRKAKKRARCGKDETEIVLTEDHIIPLRLFSAKKPKRLKYAFGPENIIWITKKLHDLKQQRLVHPNFYKQKTI